MGCTFAFLCGFKLYIWAGRFPNSQPDTKHKIFGSNRIDHLEHKSFRQIKMTTQEILNSLGQFSNFDTELFEKYSARRSLNKNEVLLNEGEVFKSFYFILSGSFSQFQTNDINEVIIDLHLQNEWMFNQLASQNKHLHIRQSKHFQNQKLLS